MNMTISKGCINLVREFEGYLKKLPNGDCTTYYCPANVLTIGYGCTEGIKKGEVWTHAQAITALKRELAKHEKAVNDLVKVDLNQNQFDALVSFSYNCGAAALGKSTLLKKLNKGDYTGAAQQFHAWKKGGGRVLPGLVRRRAQEAELFLAPVTGPGDEQIPVMAQQVDAPREPVRATMDAAASVTRPGITQDIANAVGLVVAGFSGLLQYAWDFIINLFNTLPAVTTEVGTQMESVKKVSDWVNPDPSTWVKISAGLAASLLIVALVRHFKPGTVK